MTPERWQQIDRLFEAALELEPGQRADFLNEVCAGDEALRGEVESLLSAHLHMDNFIHDSPVRGVTGLMATDDPEVVMGQLIGPYKVLREIGHGGMGTVYLAHDTRLGRRVALKLLSPEFTRNEDRLRRFKLEARTTSSLNHPNILTIHDIGKIDSTYYLATEFVEGKTLREYIMRSTVTLPEALEIAVQIGSALIASHDAGIVHRDIKPDNIMLRTDALVKVLDFGIAKLIPGIPPSTDLEVTSSLLLESKPGTVIGTPRYMSPEQACGLEVDGQTDLFSLGVVLYEMVAGRPPFAGDTMKDLLVNILTKEPVALRFYCAAVPVELERIVNRALRKEKSERYQSGRELVADLKRLAERVKAEGDPGHPDSTTVKIRVNDDASIIRPGRRYRTAGVGMNSVAVSKRIAIWGLSGILAASILMLYISRTKSGAAPATLTEFNEDFDVFNRNRWMMPASGATVGEDGRLHLANATAICFPKTLTYGDFLFAFHLKLSDAGGAAWAVRVKDAQSYYLFYLSGPQGRFPNRFTSYIVRANQFDPDDYFDSVPSVVELRSGGEYDVKIEVNKNLITHMITPADTGEEMNIGVFEDPYRLFPHGSVGFRTVGSEKFSIDEVFILPAHARSRQD